MTITGSFTGLGTAPNVLEAVPTSPTTIRVLFSEIVVLSSDLQNPDLWMLVPVGMETPRTIIEVQASAPVTYVLLVLDGPLDAGVENYEVTAPSTVEDLAGNALNVTSALVSAEGLGLGEINVGADGGGPFDLVITGIEATTYRVAVNDRRIYCGVPGSGAPDVLTFVETDTNIFTASGVYLPPNPVASYPLVLSPTNGDPSTFTEPLIHYYPASFKDRTLQLRRVLPPWYKAGLRNPELEVYPQ